MKSLLKFAVACVFCTLLSVDAMAQTTQVPHKLNVQGVLRNVAGEVVSGTYTVTFRLWSAQTGGTNLYQEPQTLSVVGGVFSTYIGPVPTSVFIDRTDVYLGITISPDATELPRRPLTAVGFTFQAEHAEEADTLLGPATDLACSTTCVASTEVAFNYALGVTKGGDAAGLTCTGCVTGGLSSDIGLNTITADNIATDGVDTAEIKNAAVTNAKLASNAVRTGNIEDGQVQTADIADGAVTSAKIAAAAITNTELGITYAGSSTKGGPASDVQCTSGSGCVDSTDVTFNYAAGDTKGGAATNVNCTATPCVSDTEITFNYAGSGSKGGAANNLACADCVDATEVAFNYAGSTTEGGAALDTNCVGCITDTDVGIVYARGVTKNGAAADLECTGCVGSTDVNFNYAAGTGPAGAATDLVCTTCVNTSDIAASAVTNSQVAAGIDGDKINAATTTTRGTVKSGSGTSVDGAGLLTVNFCAAPGAGVACAAGTASPGNHTHSGYYLNNDASNDLILYPGKRFYLKDDGSDAAMSPYMYQSTAGSNNATTLTVGFPTGGSVSAMEIRSDVPVLQAHLFRADGYAYHAGDLNLAAGKKITCVGCVDATSIADGSVTGTDIAAATIDGTDLKSDISVTTSGDITANRIYANVMYDRGNNAYFDDPASTSVMNQINYTRLAEASRGYPATNWTGIDLSGAYMNTLNTDTDQTPLEIQDQRCGNVKFFTNLCSAGTYEVDINGAARAKIVYDKDDPAWYLNPNGVSRLAFVNTTNDSWLPYNGNNYNYLRGTTQFANSTWYDENDNAYYVDPNNTSRYNALRSNGFQGTGWVGEPAGYTQMGNIGGHLVLNPDNSASQYIIMRYGADWKIYWLLGNGVDTARPSFRTNGAHLVINAAAGNGLYLNEDVGSNTYVSGNLWSYIMYDRNNGACYSDPSNTTVASRFELYQLRVNNDIYAGSIDAVQARVGNGDINAGMGVNNGTIMPLAHNTGRIGSPSAYFNIGYIVNGVATSARDKKKDIHYLTDAEIMAYGDKLMALKPTRWLYKEETMSADAQESVQNARRVPHTGLILDEMPDEITNGGMYWHLNDSIGFLLHAAKYFEIQNREKDLRIRDLEDRVALMEQALVDAGLIK